MITGHSGSGKTTLMRLLTKEYTPEEGEISFNGTLLSKIKRGKLHEHRRKIGVVFQDYRLVPEMNVWENIALPLAVTGASQNDIEERVTDLLKLVQLPEKAHLFPSQLSGGEAQRISIARALANAPSVIFADEPTGNLDQDTSQAIAHLLYQINELGTTLIFATHDPKVLSIFSDARHVHLKEGNIEFDTKNKEDKKTTTPSAESKEKDSDSEKAAKEATEAKAQKAEAAVKEAENKQSTDTASKKDEKPEEKENPETITKQPEEKKSSGGFFARLFGKKESTPPEEDDFEIEIEMVGSKEDEDSSTEEKRPNKSSESKKDEETPDKSSESDKEEKSAKKAKSESKDSKSSDSDTEDNEEKSDGEASKPDKKKTKKKSKKSKKSKK